MEVVELRRLCMIVSATKIGIFLDTREKPMCGLRLIASPEWFPRNAGIGVKRSTDKFQTGIPQLKPQRTENKAIRPIPTI